MTGFERGSGPGGIDLSIERLVLDGIDLPADAVATLPALVESELRRILDGGSMSSSSVGPDELRPIVLSTPPDVPALARELAARIAAGAAGAWDG
jgi:hypothetical protein